jgi:type I restriction enzyme S subunit
VSEIPESWAEVRFRDINTFTSSSVDPSAYPAERFELYSVPTFPTRLPELLLGTEIGSTKQAVEPQDVLVCKINPRINRVWQVMERGAHWQIASSEWIVMRAPGLCAGYLRHYFTSQGFRELICEGLTGVGGSLTRAQPKRVAEFPIPIAPLSEQNRIAEKLDAMLERVDDCREHLDHVSSVLKRFKQSVLAAATSGALTREWRESHDIVDTWRPVRLADLGELGRGKSRHRPRNDPRLYGGNYPFIQTGDIAQSGGRIESHSQTYSELGFAQSKLWPAGTVCITIAANIADTSILTYPVCFPDSVVGFVADPSRAFPEFVKWSIDVIRDRLESFAPATAQKNINLAILNEIEIRCPSLEEQAEIVRRGQLLLESANIIAARMVTAANLVGAITAGLLRMAFRGELVAQDPNDEPADDLLTRLSVELDKVRNPKQRRETGTGTKTKVKTKMLTREEIDPTHLMNILQERGALTAEALWSASHLEIDDFYDQLKDEEARGLLRENSSGTSDGPRTLEAIA